MAGGSAASQGQDPNVAGESMTLIWQVAVRPDKEKISKLKQDKFDLMEKLGQSDRKMAEVNQQIGKVRKYAHSACLIWCATSRSGRCASMLILLALFGADEGRYEEAVRDARRERERAPSG
jgi:hypothetical protein